MHRSRVLLFFVVLLCLQINSSWAIDNTPSPINDALTDNPYNDPWECSVVKDEWRCFEKLSLHPNLYSPLLVGEQKQQALVYALGWMPINSDSEAPGACRGHYYQASYIDQETSEPLKKALSKVDYSSLQYELGGTARLKGHVEIRQPGRRLHTDEAIIYPGTGETKVRRIEAYGHIRLSQPGILLLGTQGEADLESHHAKINEITYLIQVKPDWLELSSWDENFSGFAHGQASNLEQHTQTLFSLDNASYTTCPPMNNSWTLHAKNIVLDKEKGRGYAKHTILDVQGVPIFYLPYFSFPINQERQSGFLYGDAGMTSDGGVFFSLPYYFNLAPNYDWTLTPNLYSTRGVLFDNEFRYLTQYSSGKIQASYIPKDNIYGSSRNQMSFKDHTQLTDYWSTDAEYHFVSDQDYLKDFNENSSAAAANAILLPREFKTQYQHDQLKLTGSIQSYQLVNEELTLTNRPYKKLPALTASWAQDQLFYSPLRFEIQSEAVHFQKSTLRGEIPINGYRSHISTAFSLPTKQSYGYINPEARFLGTHYDLENANHSAINRNLYQISLDSGLYFDRTVQFGYRTYTQSLEPRLLYLYTPSRDQNNIPVFSTGLLAFNYANLFEKNRFTDIDRIGDTNQVAVGIESAIKNESGNNVMNIKLGQLFYLKDRDVHLCAPEGCHATEDPRYLRKSSDIITHFDTLLTPQIKAAIEFNYDPYARILDTQNYELQYHDLLDHHIFNVGYQENRYASTQLSQEQLLAGEKPAKLSQFTTSTSWQIMPQWKLVAKWDFSLNANRTIDLFSGLEYSSCCWSVRLLLHRYLVASDPNNPAALQGQLTTVPMISFVLKGLGGTDSSKLSHLEQQIPGVSETKH